MKAQKFWKWKNQSEEEPSAERVLEFYGTIAEESWYDDDITPAMFKEELFAGSRPHYHLDFLARRRLHCSKPDLFHADGLQGRYHSQD